jgi:hypothetical protein
MNETTDNPLGDRTVLQVLRAIDAWAGERRENGSDDGDRLWAVLSAMRGPDSDDQILKSRTTAVLRDAALHTLAQAGGAIVTSLGPPAMLERLKLLKNFNTLEVPADIESISDRIQYRRDEEDRRGGQHFMAHVAVAARLLLEMLERELMEKAMRERAGHERDQFNLENLDRHL